MTGPKLVCAGECGAEVGITSPFCAACRKALERITQPTGAPTPRTTGSAVFSPCRRFRHILRRSWDISRPTVGWICLNPSTAGPDEDDQSSTKMIGFSDRLGFGAYALGNLSDYIATNPKDWKRAGYPRSDEADDWIRRVVQESAGNVICAWGANARGLVRPGEVLALLRSLGVRPKALRLTADGIPWHPLMLPYSCTLIDLKT